MLLTRFTMQTVFDNLSSEIINHNTDSAYRATTLSTFNLIQSIPYVLTAFFLGALADIYSAITLAFLLGLFLLFYLGVHVLLKRRNKAMIELK